MTLPPGRYANFGGGKRAKNFLLDVGKRTVEKGEGGREPAVMHTDRRGRETGAEGKGRRRRALVSSR